MKKPIKYIAILGGIVLLGLGGWFYYSHSIIHLIDDGWEASIPPIAKEIMTTTPNGVIALYKSDNGNVLDSIDLKAMTVPGKIQAKPEQTSLPAPTVQTTSTNEKVGNYEKIEVVFKPGDTVWSLQQQLIPDIDVIDLIGNLIDVNKGESLDLVSVGSMRTLLQKPSTASIPSQTTPSASAPKTQVSSSEPVEQLSLDDTFQFKFSEDLNTLYAYSSKQNALYQVQVQKNELDTHVILVNDSLSQIVDYKVVDGKAYLLLADKTTIREINLQSQELRDLPLAQAVDTWAVHKDVLYYGFNDRLGKFDLKTGEKTTILVGDKTLEMKFIQDELYLVNQFGSQKENSILMQIDPDLEVKSLMELKNNRNQVLTTNTDGTELFVKQIEKTENQGESTDTPKIIRIDTSNLELLEERNDSPIDFQPGFVGKNGLLYQIKDRTLSVYDLRSQTKIKEFETNGTIVLPVD